MSSLPPSRRLSEQDLAQLYLHTEAPLRLDELLQGQAAGDAAQIAVHDVIGTQTPDLALISLSLSGLIVARDYPDALKADGFGPILRELIVACEDNLVSVGRMWLDSACYGVPPEPEQGRETVLSIPDRLRILTSIFMELRDGLDDADTPLARALKTLYYQSESHADLADRFVAHLTKPAKKPAKAAPKKKPVTQIPLPFDLDRPQTGADIVAFSLFRDKKR